MSIAFTHCSCLPAYFQVNSDVDQQCITTVPEQQNLSQQGHSALRSSTPLHQQESSDSAPSNISGESYDSCSLPSLDISQLQSDDFPEPSEETVLLSTSPDLFNPQINPINQQVEQPGSLNSGYKLVFDNIDKNVKPRYMRSDSQTQSLHYVQMYGVKDRVNYSSLSSQIQTELNLYGILPSSDDYDLLKKDFTILISRIIHAYVPFFGKDFENLVVKHIPHKYSHEMCKKSEVVSANVVTRLW